MLDVHLSALRFNAVTLRLSPGNCLLSIATTNAVGAIYIVFMNDMTHYSYIIPDHRVSLKTRKVSEGSMFICAGASMFICAGANILLSLVKMNLSMFVV